MMKAKIGDIEVEGTPDEIYRLVWSMGLHRQAKSVVSSQSSADKEFVSDKVAYRTLKRRPLSQQQKALFVTLGRNYPDWTSAKDLQKATNYNPNQLAGLLGALGKRVASTEGYEPGTVLLDYKWDYDNDCWLYRLPESVKTAVGRMGL